MKKQFRAITLYSRLPHGVIYRTPKSNLYYLEFIIKGKIIKKAKSEHITTLYLKYSRLVKAYAIG